MNSITATIYTGRGQSIPHEDFMHIQPLFLYPDYFDYICKNINH